VAKKQPGSAPRRTREHIIASQSHNYVEKFFIDKGHTVDRPTDYGVDVLVNTFDGEGYAESGDIRLQLKASDTFKYSSDGSYISFTIEVRHYRHWMKEPMPVFLILYDAKKIKAFWLYIQEYFGSGAGKKPNKKAKKAKSITVRVPVMNEFTEQTVDYMRARKAAILRQIEGQVQHDA
jgi:hypothetical protein